MDIQKMPLYTGASLEWILQRCCNRCAPTRNTRRNRGSSWGRKHRSQCEHTPWSKYDQEVYKNHDL